MNLFNRIVIIVLLVVFMVLCPLVLLLPEQAELALQYGANVIQWNLDWLNGLTPAAQVAIRLLMAVVGLIAFLIGLLFLVLEIIRLRRSTVKLKDEGGELMVDSVAGHLAYHIDTLADVLRVKPTVTSKGKAVRTTLYVETSPGISVPAKSAEIRQRARQIIEEQMGLQIDGEIRVIIKPVAYPKVRRVREEPPAVPEAPAEPVEPQPAVIEPFAEPQPVQTEPVVVESPPVMEPTTDTARWQTPQPTPVEPVAQDDLASTDFAPPMEVSEGPEGESTTTVDEDNAFLSPSETPFGTVEVKKPPSAADETGDAEGAEPL